MIGQTISHYKITEKLGEGGMGVVYKAEDTRLERTVALKFLASHLLEDEEGCARFIREAKAAASLDHPNICTVYEIDDAGERTFIAMAFIEGLTVKDKIAQRPLKLDQALDIAVQTAQGLQAAHEKGIVHRDIKGANIMVTPPGLVKIMDFGLAQLAERSKLTETTTILGTPSYMSPEQAVGEKTDRRTDLWSLGVVLYEMIAGRLPFVGERQEAVLYGISSEEPEPVTAQRAGLPMELEWIIGKALAKDREERYQHAEDVLVDLRSLKKKLASGKSSILKARAGTQTIATQPAKTEQASPGPLARYRVIEDAEEAGDAIKYVAEDTELHRSVAIRVLPQSSAEQIERAQRRKQTLALGAGALGLLAALVFASLWLFSPAPVAEAPLRRFAFTPESLHSGPYGRTVISPDGKHIVYLGGGEEQKLWVRDVGREQPRELAGTENARHQGLFWSPDSQFIGFAAGNELKKVSVQGGPAITLCPLPGTIWEGGAWSPDGSSIVFSAGSGFPVLHDIPARGGEPKLLFEPETSEKGPANIQPHFLPVESGARSIVYNVGSYTDREIVVKNLETGEREVLADGAFPRYSPSGHILYQTAAFSPGLWALPFSLETLKPTGEAFPIAENGGDPSVAEDGTLVYVDVLGGGRQQLVWRDREGKKLGVIGQPQDLIRFPALSPDGRHVAVRGLEDNNEDVWVHEVGRSLKRRLTFDAALDGQPIWSPSGKGDRFLVRSRPRRR